MKPFSKEQIEALSQWEDRLYTAYNSKFYRNISSKSLDTIKAIYESVADEQVSVNLSCSHCVLSFLATVGKKYFEDKEALVKKAEKVVKALDEVFDEVSDALEPKPVKKAPAKKSNNRATKKK